MDIVPIVLEGGIVKLTPMEIALVDDLCDVGLQNELWQWTAAGCYTRNDMKSYVKTALDEQRRGLSLPFVTRERSSDRIIGSTRFGNIDTQNRKAEIGWTWINPQWQRTAVNTEAKFLMLRHAFEVWKCIRVELKTDMLNEKSRNAILRIGAKEEGILRNHMITQGGRYRDSVYFSIIESEWPEVKKRLIKKLDGEK